MLVFKLSRPFQMKIFVIVFHLVINHPVRFLQERSQVDTTQIDADCKVPLIHLA